MLLKDQVLEALENAKGDFVSGGQLAERFFVSRNAIWKAVNALRDAGHKVLSVTNKGYCLETGSDVLSTQGIGKYLGEYASKVTIEVYNKLPSTNTLSKEKAIQGGNEGLVIIADHQTGGRGRLGRTFLSPAGTGIYFSVLLRPKFKAEVATMITAAAAVAVAEAIECLVGVEAKIKWVNDVFCLEKKVAGILTEGAFDFESGGMEYVILGIGVNVIKPQEGFPDQLSEIAGAVVDGTELPPDLRSRLIAEIIKKFWKYYSALSDKSFLADYKARSFVVGMPVDVVSGESVRAALALDIDDTCKLIVRYEDGTIDALSSGEVSIRPHKK